ncbi:WhiB family transcriptional regulator [Streptomyces sp. ALI-76-A]|uniref:WhiB family transcriptional regulator n=1 Tax=Streptomyces sp. ALI-76-A TaxID=3025736 RepID=UPI00256EB7DD|nr:WhiB family transcriptional regulator [Streptomyces sp. ALI-76-A]MDL5205087.1 WhiB family transcriptional regulator [Streptomyces sp. ALI-76-A]
MIPNLDWLRHAVCAGMDQRAFFATGRHARAQVFAAKRVCDACPVREQCREWAIESGERWGVWGGMSQDELRKKRRRFTSRAKAGTRPAPKKREPAKCGTRPGYQKHLREKTPVCGPCRQANTDADNRLRRTGTSKVLAP